MIYAFTGHRPDKLGGYDQVTYQSLIDFAKSKLVDLKPDKCISGMALGWDIAVAAACEGLKIPYIAAIPFPEQAKLWSNADQFIWDYYKSRACEVIMVCPNYSKAAFQKRNEWMVNHSDHLIALWDGSKGGTFNTVEYAVEVNKPLTNWWKNYLQYKQDLNSLSRTRISTVR